MNEDLKKGNAGTDMKYDPETIRDKLYQAMKQKVYFNIDMLQKKPIKGKYDFKHLCKVHAAIFNGVYNWAGEPRTVDIRKEEFILDGLSIEYSKYDRIEDDAKKVLDHMNGVEWSKLSSDKRIEEFSNCMANLWKVHPFKDGNTRTVIVFFADFAKTHGFGIDRLLLLKHDKYVRNSLAAASAKFAFLGDISEPQYLRDIIEDGMKRWEEQDKNREQSGKLGLGYGMKAFREKTQKSAGLGSNDSDKKYNVEETVWQFKF